MKKILLQGLVLLLFLAGGIYLLTRVDWIRLLRIDKATAQVEQKLGDLIWSQQDIEELPKDTSYRHVDSLIRRLCVANGIDVWRVKLHLVENGEVNALALPDYHMVVYSGLLKNVKNDGELAGVLGHELAHMELQHVMKKLGKEIGLSVLVSITTGELGGDAIKEVIGMLSSSAYDRKLEKDADVQAVKYLKNAGIDRNDFANFLDRLGKEEAGVPKELSWLSTHPDSRERARYIRGMREKGRVTSDK
jgi:beta-barrel assembly-enhancing protease